MTNNTDATELAKPNKTNETTRETHLNRVYEISYLLGHLRGEARIAGNEREAKRLAEQAASLRWLIERERARS